MSGLIVFLLVVSAVIFGVMLFIAPLMIWSNTSKMVKLLEEIAKK